MKITKSDAVVFLSAIALLTANFLKFNVEKFDGMRVRVEDKSLFSSSRDLSSVTITEVKSGKKHDFKSSLVWDGYTKLEEGKTGTLDAEAYTNGFGIRRLSVQRFKPDAEAFQSAELNR